MKKVFSIEKYVENRKNDGDTDEEIRKDLISWVSKCDGLTEEEMHNLHYGTCDEWMVEVKGKNNFVDLGFYNDEPIGFKFDTSINKPVLMKRCDNHYYAYPSKTGWIFYRSRYLGERDKEIIDINFDEWAYKVLNTIFEDNKTSNEVEQMNEEYTYNIGKYTIGVDTNGEDGIGLTVAIINDDGEIHFLGNCYGDNARCVDLLIKENQQLKEQLEASEKARKESMLILGEYRHYTMPTEEQNRENEDIVDKAYNNLILKQDIDKGE